MLRTWRREPDTSLRKRKDKIIDKGDKEDAEEKDA